MSSLGFSVSFDVEKLSNFADGAVFIVCPFTTVSNQGLIANASDTVRAQESEHSDEG